MPAPLHAVFNALVLSALARYTLRFSNLCWQLTRRTKSDPHVAQQLQILLEWIQVSSILDVGERAAYDAALADLRTSYEALLGPSTPRATHVKLRPGSTRAAAPRTEARTTQVRERHHCSSRHGNSVNSMR